MCLCSCSKMGCKRSSLNISAISDRPIGHARSYFISRGAIYRATNWPLKRTKKQPLRAHRRRRTAGRSGVNAPPHAPSTPGMPFCLLPPRWIIRSRLYARRNKILRLIYDCSTSRSPGGRVCVTDWREKNVDHLFESTIFCDFFLTDKY